MVCCDNLFPSHYAIHLFANLAVQEVVRVWWSKAVDGPISAVKILNLKSASESLSEDLFKCLTTSS